MDFESARRPQGITRRSCLLSLIPIDDVPAAAPVPLRVLDGAEAGAALRLVRAAHQDHDLFPFPDVTSLRERLARLSGFGFRGMYGWGSGESLSGCFGLWDYSPVMRMHILQEAGEWSWAAGRDLHLVFLMPLGFGDGTDLVDAVRLAASHLRQEPGSCAARVLAVPHDLADPAYAPLDVFRPVRLGFTLFGVELDGARGVTPGGQPVYVDPADL